MVKILKWKFRRDFETEVWSVFSLWCLVAVMKLSLGRDSDASLVKINQDAYVWLRFWSWCLVEILKMKFEDLCKNLWYELNPWVRCAFGMVLIVTLACLWDFGYSSRHAKSVNITKNAFQLLRYLYILGECVEDNVIMSMSNGILKTAAECIILLHLVAALPIIINPPSQFFEELLHIPQGISIVFKLVLRLPRHS